MVQSHSHHGSGHPQKVMGSLGVIDIITIMFFISICNFIAGSLELKFPTVWTNGKAQPGRISAMEKVRREKIRDETDQPRRKSEMRKKIRDEKDQTGRKGRKVALHCVFPMLRGSGGSKSRLAKAAGAEVEHVGLGPLLDVAISKKCKPLWREAYLQ